MEVMLSVFELSFESKYIKTDGDRKKVNRLLP